MPTCSVLICTYNRPHLLSKALWALIETAEEKPDQVVVVNGGDAETDRIVESFVGHCGVQVELVKTKNKNLAASRNVGLPHCTGDLIAMTDDDAEVFPNWVTQMKRAHHIYADAGAVGGAVIGTDNDLLISRISDQITFPVYSGVRQVRTLPGVNISYKRECVEKLGMQDETLFRGEDVDYNWRLLQLGYKIYFDPDIKIYHHHRPTLRALLNQQYMYGRAYYLVRRKWPEMYCVYPHALRHPKDFLKGANFFVAVFYEPWWYAGRMRRWTDRLGALPILFLNGLGWRAGMLKQKWIELRNQSNQIA